MRRGRDGAAIAYSIQVTVLLILRASAILSAPRGPIVFQRKLSQRQRDEEGRGCHCLLYCSNGVVDLESLGNLLGSNVTNIIIPQADSERQREMRSEEEGTGSHCLPYSSDGVVDLESLGNLLGSNVTNIIIPQANSEREREMRRGREGAAITYSIVVMVLLILRASAIFSAPMGPIWFILKLIQREDNGDRWWW
jgi:hypothetical protein